MKKNGALFVRTCWTAVLLSLSATQVAGAASSLPVKMSITGVCYDPAVTSERPLLATGHFATMEACLKAKGRAAPADGSPQAQSGGGAAAPVSPATSAPAAPAAAKAAAPAVSSPAPRPRDRALYDSDDAALVKRGADDVCRDGRDPQFGQLLHFRTYRTLQDCLDSGGHR
jgi:hypothetical protein